MRIRLLPSSFDEAGSASPRQHLACFLINGCVALDAGSLAFGVTDTERAAIRDIVLTHAHLDHVAGLPLFIDDLFSQLKEPVRVHATKEVIDALETHIFNWVIYPRFSELTNRYGKVIEYRAIESGDEFDVVDLRFLPIGANHKVPSDGFAVSDKGGTVVLTGDTAELGAVWDKIDAIDDLRALFIECAFPNELEELARTSHHLTPERLAAELTHFGKDCPVYVINIKPKYRDEVCRQIAAAGLSGLNILEAGREYTF